MQDPFRLRRIKGKTANAPMVLYDIRLAQLCVCVCVLQYHHLSLKLNESNKYDKHAQSVGPSCSENKDLTVI